MTIDIYDATERPAFNGMIADPGKWTISAEQAQQAVIRQPWSHQNELNRLRGKRIDIVFTGGQRVTTRLLEADYVSLLVERNGGSTVLFKSDIVEFCEAAQ